MQHFMSEHPRLSHIVNRGNVMKFSELPQTAQDAIIHYMSVDGAAWAVKEDWPDWKWGEGKPSTPEMRQEALDDIAKFRAKFIENWGDEPFGFTEVDPQELLESMKGDEFFVDDSFNENNETCSSDSEYSEPTWPVILSAFPCETLQDGWHRFGRYLRLQKKTPVIWYVD